MRHGHLRDGQQVRIEGLASMQMSPIPWERWLNVNIRAKPDSAYSPGIEVGGDKKHRGVRWKRLIL